MWFVLNTEILIEILLYINQQLKEKHFIQDSEYLTAQVRILKLVK